MMEPLRKQADSADPDVSSAARLISSANRPDESAVAKARVRRAVMARLSGAGAPMRARLRPPVVVGIVLLATSAAAASVTWVVARYIEDNKQEAEVTAPKGPLVIPDRAERGGGRVSRAASALELSTIPGIDVPWPSAELLVASLGAATPTGVEVMPPLVPPPARIPRKRIAKSVKAPVPATAPIEHPLPPSSAPVQAPAVAQVAVVIQPPVELAPAPLPAQPELAKPEPAKPEVPPEVEVTPDVELSLVQSAFSALRRERNPQKAAIALDSYLRRYPRGKLAEEALGLSIEAYATLNDARAAERAARYLDRYPSGRYRGAASRALSRFPQ